MSVDSIIDSLGGDPGYIKFLLAERPYIRSALMARGVCFDEEARTLAYPTSIGNSLHNDLIEIERWLTTLSPQDKDLLNGWASGSTARPAFGGTQLGRINRLIEAFIHERETQGKTQAERPGSDAAVRGHEAPERGTATGETNRVPDVLPSVRNPRAGGLGSDSPF